jgi:hypothetical protein
LDRIHLKVVNGAAFKTTGVKKRQAIEKTVGRRSRNVASLTLRVSRPASVLLNSEIPDDWRILFLGDPIEALKHQIDNRNFQSMIRALDQWRPTIRSVSPST